MYCPLNDVSLTVAQLTCTFSSQGRCAYFLKGIEMCRANGLACPSRKCQFRRYEELPAYQEPPRYEISAAIEQQ